MPEKSELPTVALSVEVVSEGKEATLRLSGEFDLAELEAARKALEQALGDGDQRLTIDLRDLTFIDSTGIAFLLSVANRDGEGAVRFIPSESPAVRRVLRITGVDARLGAATRSGGSAADG